MTRKKKEQTDAFMAFDEAGNGYRIMEYTEYLNVGPTIGHPGDRWTKGILEYRTAGGDPVNRIEGTENEFDILDFSEKIRVIKESSKE